MQTETNQPKQSDLDDEIRIAEHTAKRRREDIVEACRRAAQCLSDQRPDRSLACRGHVEELARLREPDGRRVHERPRHHRGAEGGRAMKPSMNERERQRAEVPGYEWIVVSHEPRGVTVTCRAPSESGAYRVAEAEHPGVWWAYVSRRECYCHDRIDCRYAHDVCAACERPAQHLDMGTRPAPNGMAGPRVCGLCYRLALGLTFAELRARVAEMRGPGVAADEAFELRRRATP